MDGINIRIHLWLTILIYSVCSSQVQYLTGRNGTIEGRCGYNESLQVFRIKVTESERAFIDWLSVGLDGRLPDCTQHYVEVSVGGCSTQAQTLARFCGKSSDPLPNSIYSLDNCITIALHVQPNNYMNHSQLCFKISYNEVNSSMSADCFIGRDNNNILHTPNWPQSYELAAATATCSQQQINITNNYAMKMFIMSVDTDSSNGHTCKDGQADYLQVKSSWTCAWYYTPWNNDGDGHASYLDRHYVNCGRQNLVIVSFQLVRNDAHQYRYKYQCCPSRGTCRYITKTTARQYVNNKESDAKTLNKHSIDCGINAYVSEFRYRLDRDRFEMWYDYTCCHQPYHSVVCKTIETTETQASTSAFWLDRQLVDCVTPTWFGIQQFALSTRSFKVKKKKKTNWKYNYKCCYHVSPIERIKRYCGKHEIIIVDVLPKGTPNVKLQFFDELLTNDHQKSGVMFGYTLYNTQPHYFMGDEKYLIPYSYGNHYVGEYQRESGDVNKKELHLYDEGVAQKFQIVPGMSGKKDQISVRSVLSTTQYIFTVNDEVLLAAEQESDLLPIHFKDYASFYIREYEHCPESIVIELSRPMGRYLLVVEDNRLQVWEESHISDKRHACFKLSSTAPVQKKGSPETSESNLWIIGLILVILFLYNIFGGAVLRGRFLRMDRENKAFHKKLLAEAEGED